MDGSQPRGQETTMTIFSNGTLWQRSVQYYAERERSCCCLIVNKELLRLSDDDVPVH